MTILETGALATKTGTTSPAVLEIIGSVLRITCQVGFERLADMLSIYPAHRGQAIRALSKSSPSLRAAHRCEERQRLRRKRPIAQNMRFLHFYDICLRQQWRGLRRFLAFLSGEGAGSGKRRDIPSISLRQIHFCPAAELTAPHATAAAVKAGIPGLVRKAGIPALANTSTGVRALALKANESRWGYRFIPIPSQGGEQRAVFFMDQPLVCSVFYLVVAGAFGVLVLLYDGRQPSFWEVLHLGVSLYALAHYPQIFVHEWRGDGKERRGLGAHGSGAPGTLGTPRPPRGRR